jgi:hypothetical protein
MTRRARWTRPFAALFALWFAVIIGDPGLLHACPMHGNHGSAHAAAASTAGGHHAATMHTSAATSDEASSNAPAGMSHQTSHDASHHSGSNTCTCVGQCCATPAIAPVPAVANLHVPATVALVEPVQRVALQPATTAPDLRLPFANGPPTA